MAQCANCGVPLAPDARFCSKCGAAVAVQAPIVTSPPHPVVPQRVQAATTAPPRRSTWWIVPTVIVGLIVIAWLVLAGLPFGGEKQIVATETTETIAEGTTDVAPEPTGTVVDLGTEEPPFATQTIEVPPLTQTTTQTATRPATQPPVIVEERPVTREAIPAGQRPIPRPQPVETREPEPPPEETRDAISEAEASSALRSHLASANPYDGVSQSCLQLRSVGYRNVGYTFAVWDACVEGGGARMLGRWRVDAKTREVFRQRDDGRYR